MGGQLVVVALWIGILPGGSYTCHTSRTAALTSVSPGATTSLLSVPWQVQDERGAGTDDGRLRLRAATARTRRADLPGVRAS